MYKRAVRQKASSPSVYKNAVKIALISRQWRLPLAPSGGEKG
jgi:hypothetical protein